MLSDVAGLRKVLLRHISRQKLPSLSIPGGVSQVDMANREKVLGREGGLEILIIIFSYFS